MAWLYQVFIGRNPGAVCPEGGGQPPNRVPCDDPRPASSAAASALVPRQAPRGIDRPATVPADIANANAQRVLLRFRMERPLSPIFKIRKKCDTTAAFDCWEDSRDDQIPGQNSEPPRPGFSQQGRAEDANRVATHHRVAEFTRAISLGDASAASLQPGHRLERLSNAHNLPKKREVLGLTSVRLAAALRMRRQPRKKAPLHRRRRRRRRRRKDRKGVAAVVKGAVEKGKMRLKTSRTITAGDASVSPPAARVMVPQVA